jgi:hypothetical protein
LSGNNENRPYFEEHTMALKYSSGEDIRLGDRATHGGTQGTIELVVDAPSGDPESDWHFENNGAGIMLAEPRVFGRVYLTAPLDEDLVFVARGSEPPPTTPDGVNDGTSRNSRSRQLLLLGRLL